jgi:NDP-sugar pyrophosphorylase family protein
MKAVILAGGLGNRLKPFTEVIPKPLLPIGEKSVLEIQMTMLQKYGFDEIYLATNYKSDYIENFFSDTSRLRIKLKISRENKPLGTCGPLSLLKTELGEPFLVMNGDILTTTDFSQLYDFALNVRSDFVVATKEIIYPFEFGNVTCEGSYIREVQEKPDLKIEIIAGIYIMKPPVFNLIPDGEYFGMDHLLKKMLGQGMPVARYLLKEYWIDIGRIEDYEKAEADYNTHFKMQETAEKT